MSYVYENGAVSFAPWFGIPGDVKETLEFATEILLSCDGTEQRIAKRQGIPRQIITIPYLLDTEAVIARFDSILHTWAKKTWGVPLWFEAENVATTLASGSSSIAFDTRYADYRADSFALLWQENQYEVVEIDSVADSALALADTTTLTFTAPYWIMPCRQGYLRGLTQRARYSSFGIEEMTFDVVDIAALTRTAGETAALTTYDGYEVLTTAPYADQTLGQSHDPDVLCWDAGTGIFTVRSDSDFNRTLQEHRWAHTTKADCWALRKFFHAMKGRQGAFLVPTWQEEITLARATASEDTSLYVTNRSFVTMDENTLRTYVMFLPAGSTPRLRKVTGISAVSASEEKFDLSATVGAVYAAGTNLCWVDKCRLAADEINLDWLANGAHTCTMDLMRVSA